jgi:hypothetical protein
MSRSWSISELATEIVTQTKRRLLFPRGEGRIDRSSVQSLQKRLHIPRLSCNLLFGHATCSPGLLSAAPSAFWRWRHPQGSSACQR